MEKIDYKKDLKQFYGGKVDNPVIVQVPAMNYLMVDGRGDPNTSLEYIDAIQALYPVAYSLKFMCKKEKDIDFAVMPLEGLWWSDDMTDFITGNKSNWQWTAMIMQPEFITPDMFKRAVQEVLNKKSLSAINKIRFHTYAEGRAAQVMYIGPYANEGPTIVKLHEFIKKSGGVINADNKHHHEIYLNDPRRSAPEKLKTIIRQPY